MKHLIIKGLKTLGKIILSKSQKEENGSLLHKCLIGIVIFFFLLVLVPASALSLPGLLGKSENPKSFEYEESKLYENIGATYIEYQDKIDKKISNQAEKLRNENSYEKTEIDEDGKETKVTKYPEVEVIRDLESPNLSLVFAFITTKYTNYQNIEKGNAWSYDNKEILAFLNKITTYKKQVNKKSKSKIILTVTTTIKSEEEIAKLFFKDEVCDMYLFSCSTFHDLDYESSGNLDYANMSGSLGWVSRLYETGNPNGQPGLISTGVGDKGGKSYGTCQFSLTMGSLKSFVTWLKGYDYDLYEPLSGLTVGSSSFDAAWKKIAKEHTKKFAEAQNIRVYESHVKIWIKNAYARSGIDFERSYALQEMAYSRAVQHGGNGAMSVFSNAGISKGDSDQEIITKFYTYLHNHVKQYWSGCSSNIQAGVAKRMINERGTLLSLVGKEREKEENEDKKGEKKKENKAEDESKSKKSKKSSK